MTKPLSREEIEELLAYCKGELGPGAHSVSFSRSRIAALCRQLLDALWFVPLPKDMSGYGDPDAPDEAKEAIERAARAHGLESALARGGALKQNLQTQSGFE